MPSSETTAARPTEATGPPPPTRQELLADLASTAGLSVEDIDPGEDFAGLGIDSIRLMRLVDHWRRAGLAVTFAELAACESVAQVLHTALPHHHH